MSLKNINEIQSNDYRSYDQQFIKETLSALANSGQRYGTPGSGVVQYSFKASDVFPSCSTSDYSYIQCEANISITDVTAYRDLYGDIIQYHTEQRINDKGQTVNTDVANKSYLIYYNIEKVDNSWVKTVLNNSISYLDAPNSFEPIKIVNDVINNYEIDTSCIQISNESVSDKVSNYSTSYILATGYGNCAVVQESGSTLAFKYETCFNVCSYIDSDVLDNIYIYYNQPTSSGTGALVAANIRPTANLATDYPATYYDVWGVWNNTSPVVPITTYKYVLKKDGYNIYYIKELDKEGVCDGYIADAVLVAKGYHIVNNVFDDKLGFESDCADIPLLYIIHKKEDDLWYVKYSNEESKALHKYDVDVIQSIMEDIVPSIKSTISSKYKEDIKKQYLDTLFYNITNDHISEYIDSVSDITTDDYLKTNIYFNPYLTVNTWVSSLDNSIIYSTSDHINAEYCTNVSIYNTIEGKVIGKSDNNVRFKSVVADWTDIESDKYDSDYRKFDIYDKNILYGIKTNWNTTDTTSISTFINMEVYLKYTFPYINRDKYWVINGETTPVSAVGLNADQPSMIMLYSESESNDDISVLTTLHKADIEQYTTLYDTYVTLSANITVSGNKISTPVIDIENLERGITDGNTKADILRFVKSSVIMSIIKAPERLSKTINNGYITTFWVYTEKDEYGNTINKFTCVTNNGSNSALDLASMASVYGLIEAGFKSMVEEPDKYVHAQLVFSPNNQKVKHEVESKDNSEPVSSNERFNIIGAIQNFDYTVMFDKDKANKYGMLPYVTQESNDNTNDNNRTLDSTATIAFYDKYELEYISSESGDVSSQIQRGSVQLSDNNTSVGITFKDNNKVTTSQLYKYKTGQTGVVEFVESNSYIPTANSKDVKQPPLVDMSSVLNNHFNVLNRVNIISPGEQDESFESVLYASYIGTRFDDNEKSHFVIGTSNEMVDLSRHVADPIDMTKFETHDEIDINFNSINLNGDINFGGSGGLLWNSTRVAYKDTKNFVYQCTLPVYIQNTDNPENTSGIKVVETVLDSDLNVSERVTCINVKDYINALYKLKQDLYIDNSCTLVPLVDYEEDSTKPLSTHLLNIFAYRVVNLGGKDEYHIFNVKTMYSHQSCLYV